MSPAEKEARQMIADRKAGAAAERAFNAASQTPAAPAERPAPAAQRRPAAVEEAVQEMQDAKMRKRISDMGYAKGGKVSSASRRADGIATKGKTKGRMI